MTQTATAPATTKASERLTAKLQFVVPTMQRETQAMWAQPAVRETYLEWLRVLHAMIRATVPIMMAATEECLHRVDDPVAEGFARYLAKHIREEWGHDTWAAEDYEAAGCDPGELRDLVVGPAVATIVGSQYYWIHHVHPIALLGHMAVLEGYPPSTRLPAILSERTGFPLTAFRALERHAVVDQRHRIDLYRQIDTLPLLPRHETLIGMSALHTASTVCDLVRGVRERIGG
jgi:hypothetical protein